MRKDIHDSLGSHRPRESEYEAVASLITTSPIAMKCESSPTQILINWPLVQ